MWDAPWHWAVVALVAFALFGGYKKLPEASRSLGRSLRIFKTELKGLTDDDNAREQAGEQAPNKAEDAAHQPGVGLSKDRADGSATVPGNRPAAGEHRTDPPAAG